MMKLRYYSKFNDVNNDTITINIYKEGYNGEADIFLLSADPLTINYETDDVFKPIKYSGCSIRVLTPHILKDLYIGKVTDVYIEIIKDDNVVWCGYNTPNIYNQEWVTDLDETTIEGIDTLSALQYFDYTYMNQNTSMLFYDVIKHCLDFTRKNINTLKYRNQLGDNDEKLLIKLKCLERNFFDESENPIKCNEVLEHIMQFLGVTLYQWGNIYYISDNDSLFRDEVKCYTFDLTQYNATPYYTSFNPKHYEVGENTSTVSFGDVYNQVNVIGNLLEFESTNIIDINEIDKDDFVSVDGGKYTVDLYDETDKNCKRIHYHYFDKPSWNNHYSTPTSWQNEYYSTPSRIRGGVFVREAVINSNFTADYGNHGYIPYFNYKLESEINWETYFSFNIRSSIQSCYKNAMGSVISNYPSALNDLVGTPVINKTSKDVISYPTDGYLLLHYSFDLSKHLGRETKFCKNPYVRIRNAGNDKLGYYNEYHKPKYLPTGDTFDTNTGFSLYLFGFKAELSIGEKYWNGTTWQDEQCTFTFRTQNRQQFNVLEGELDYSRWETWEILNTNEYSVNTTSNSNGWLIPITSTLTGKLNFKLYDCVIRPPYNSEIRGATEDEGEYNYINVKNLSIEYTPKYESDIYNIDFGNEDNEDLKYSQDIDNNNVSEFNDITLYLNTYNPSLCKKLSYSYVLDDTNNYLMKLSKDGTLCRPEEHIVRQYATHYSLPKVIHSNTIKSGDIEPMDVVYVNSLGKFLMVGSITYNLTFNNADVNLYEL